MAINLTEAQKNAVKAKGSVIVTAAAGSGKTAVLVERVIERLCDMENPVSADRLLIVTFTNPAAAEMKQRIEKRLASECEAHPDNTYLLRQKLLISSADICTIDSFCIKLIRANFNLLNISPDFKIADNATSENIRNRVLSEIFKERFAKKSSDFFEFLHACDLVYGDENAMKFIFKLYDYSMVLPFPENWFKMVEKSYDSENFTSSPFGIYIFERVKTSFKSYANMIINHIDNISGDMVLFEKAEPALKSFLRVLEKCIEAAEERDWESIRQNILNLPSVPRIMSKKCDRELLLKTKEIFKSILSFCEEFKYIFEISLEDIKSELLINGNIIKEMVEICREFSKRYFNELNKKGYLTFAVTEQLAFKLLCENHDGDFIPTAISKELCDMYDEVMVDEYQDVNDLQNALFEVLSDGGKHLFTVGDAKQSIYGFRGSNPENFINRSNTAKLYDEKISADTVKRVVLSNNFRSRKGVCNFINAFFTITMSEDFGGVAYDRFEKLYPLADFPENGECETEIHFTEAANKDEQAKTVAAYISETLKKSPFLIDKTENEKLRKAKFGDFAILLRNTIGFESYVKALKEEGIPVSICNGNYFETLEIKTMISFLRAVNTPMNDNAMLAVLMSPVFGFTSEEVAELKADDIKKRFYSLIISAAAKGNERCVDFINRFSKLRKKAACLSTADFVHFLLEDTDYISFVSSFNESERRINNLMFLEELAEGYSSEFSGDLGSFIGYLNYLEMQGETKSKSASGENSVIITTMHKSKGLQFPITIITETNTHFSFRDTAAPLSVNDKLGVAFNRIDDEKNISIIPVTKRIMNNYLCRKQREEELRLLYVAMTRAEEKLVIFCQNKNNKLLAKTAKTLLGGLDSNEGLNPQTVAGSVSFAEWISFYALMLPEGEEIRKEFEMSDDLILNTVKEYGNAAKLIFYNEKSIKSDEKEEIILDIPSVDENLLKQIKEIFEYKYPFDELRKIEAKTSVSRLAKKKADIEFCATARPAFLAAGGLSPTERGTALHKFMQYANFNNAVIDVSAEIERLKENEFISKAEAKAINTEQIEIFMNTPLFSRITASKRVLREQRFLLEVPAEQLYPELVGKKIGEQKVIIQGAVDCIFFEDGNIILIDFKTDRTNNEAFLLEHYSEQLKIYSVAMYEMFKCPVKECYIYSLNMNKWITVKLD